MEYTPFAFTVNEAPFAAINLLTNVSAATNEYVLTKDTATGNAIFKASTGTGSSVVSLNDQTISADYTLASGKNASAVGDVTVADNVTLTISDNSVFLILDTNAADNSQGDFESGIWTPTLASASPTFNVAASTAYSGTWTRIGDVVTCGGRVDIDPTSAAPSYTTIGISLPVPSLFTAETDLSGTSVSFSSTVITPGHITADPATDMAVLGFLATSTSNLAHVFTFQYKIV